VEAFLSEYFVIPSPDDISGLCVELGPTKRDKHKVSLMVWDDKECPEFSAVKAVLIWMSISGIKSGRLFPLFDKRTDKLILDEHGNVKPFPYSKFLDEIKYM
jgi:hypothetical protein